LPETIIMGRLRPDPIRFIGAMEKGISVDSGRKNWGISDQIVVEIMEARILGGD
jgi:hypothetical protein